MSSINWVTESGDMLSFDPATATTTSVGPGLYVVITYPVHLTGGTGKFAGVKGDFNNIGEVDLNSGQLVLRRSADGLGARIKFSLLGADAMAIWPAEGRPAISGRLGLSAELEGNGLSPASLNRSVRPCRRANGSLSACR